MSGDEDVLWRPADDVWSTSRLGRFAARHHPAAVGDYNALWRWSVADADAFWRGVWDEFALGSGAHPGPALAVEEMPGAVWFPDASLNYAELMLRGNGRADEDVVVVAESQTREPVSLTLARLRDDVRRAATGLRRLGVRRGDRVVAYLPNIPETLVAFLATASIGAVWSSCAPEFGARSVISRWLQVEPTVLLTIDGYVHGTKHVDRRAEVAEILAALPSVRHHVTVPYLHPDVGREGASTWAELMQDRGEPLSQTPLPFDHPLCILYSSGTTGPPKPIIHGHGGIAVEHVKSLGLQLDLGPDDTFFWFSTTGWMMWNYLVSGLLVGATIVLHDGDPGHPDLGTLWSLSERTRATFVGVSSAFLLACRRAGITPGSDHDLRSLRAMGSTGSPLPSEGFRWVYEAVGADLQLSSVSGGTDICSGFVGASPVLPVRAGVIAARQLGCNVQAWDADGRSIVGDTGELVVTTPMPSMPVGFWGDDDGTRMRESYFNVFPGVWRHGDWITMNPDGSSVITGRSDATLNRGGVRLGTSEFYTVAEGIPEVVDSLVVHVESPEGGMGALLLFVVLAEGRQLDEDLRNQIARTLRSELSPRHVPDRILAVRDVPRTLTGKKLELPVKRIIQGVPMERAASPGSLVNPDVLEDYVRFAGQ